MGAEIVIVMGVSGSGKSTIGRKLAKEMDRPFLEGDDFHPDANREKMAAGRPLTNEDRQDWINGIVTDINQRGEDVVLACSALNDTVRGWLRDGVDGDCHFVHLTGSPHLIRQRITSRKGHFFDPTLLDSQFEALKAPSDAIVMNVGLHPNAICRRVIKALNEKRQQKDD